MGLTNKIITKKLKKQAKKVVDSITKKYIIVKFENPDLEISEICFKVMKVLGFNIDNLSEEDTKMLKQRFIHISGLVYTIGIDLAGLNTMMLFRQLQLTKYYDLELEAKGFEKASIIVKEKILKVMKLYIENWKEITGDK